MVVVSLHAHQDRIAGAGVQVLKDIAILPVDAAIDAVLGTRDGGGSQGGGSGFLQGGHRGFLRGLLDDQLGRVGAGSDCVAILGGKLGRHLILARIGGRGRGGLIVLAHIGDGHRGDARDTVSAMVGLHLPIVGGRLILQDRRQRLAVLDDVHGGRGQLLGKLITVGGGELDSYLVVSGSGGS